PAGCQPVAARLAGARIHRLLVVEPRPADAGEEHAADAADDADRRQRRLDQRETQLRVREVGVLSGELQVVVAAQLTVAAEVEEVGEVADALEAAEARR